MKYYIDRDKLRLELFKRNMTQEQVAKYLNIDRVSFNNKLNKRTFFNEEEICKLKNKFGKSIFFN